MGRSMRHNTKKGASILHIVSNRIKKLYVEDKLSAEEIRKVLIEKYELTISTRHIQRYLKDMGVIRNHRNSFIIAIEKGRMSYPKRVVPKPRKTIQRKQRLAILIRDGFKCVFCGVTAKDSRLEVDHKDNDPTNNDPSNLQTLCKDCNMGKFNLNYAN